MKIKFSANKPLISLLLSGIVGIWAFIVYCFVDFRAVLAGLIAVVSITIFYVFSKKAKKRNENNGVVLTAHLMGMVITYAAAFNFGVSTTNCIISACLMPLLASGAMYLWWDISNY